MQIFDFTDGVKGELLGETSICHASGGWLVEKNNQTYKISIANPRNNANQAEKWHWAISAENKKRIEIKPEDYGVEAICFCKGEFWAGNDFDNSYWVWIVLGTNDWNRQACQQGILKATRHG